MQGQPTITESGGQFDIEGDVRALETLTVSVNDTVSSTVTDADITVTLTTEDGSEVPVPLGEPVDESLDGFSGLANITVSITETANVTAGDELLFDHAFAGIINTVSVTTGPTRLVDAAGTVSSVSIDADFIGTVNDQPTTRVTATGVVKDGAQSDGDKLTFTIDGQPVDTAVTSGGEATGVVFAETLDLEPQENVTVDVREFETAQTDTVDTVDEVIELETGFNLRSVPQPATLKTQDVSSLNRWNSETQTYEAVTSSVFDSAADLHNGLYIRATSDEARIGLTFDQNGSVNATEDINTQWNLVGTNFAIDSSGDGEVQIDQDLANMGVSALNLSSDDGQSLDENSTVDVFQACWAHNPTETVDRRAIVSPGYDEQSRRALLGSYSSQPSDSNFQPRITDITTTNVPDADSRITLNDREVVGASEQVVLVNVTVKNEDSGTDVQFVTLEVAPQFGGDRENASFERVDQTGIVLGAGSGSVTLAYVASQDDVNSTSAEDIAINVTTENGFAQNNTQFNSGGITVRDQAVNASGEFLVDSVDVAGRDTVELVNQTGAVLDSRQFSQGIDETVIFSDFNRTNVTENVTVEVRGELGNVLVNETVTVFDTASVSLSDQTFAGNTSQITVNSSDLQATGPADYRIVVHDQTQTTSGPVPDDVGPRLGVSDVLNGSETGTTITLDSNISSTQSVLVMVHFSGEEDTPGSPIPIRNGNAFGIGDGQAGTVTDTATVTDTSG